MVWCRQWQQLVESMTTGVRVKMVWMDTVALQEQLRSTLQRALGVICMVLEVSCHERLIATLGRLQRVIKSMSAKPVALAQFTEFVRELKAMQASQGEVLAEVDVITVCSLHAPSKASKNVEACSQVAMHSHTGALLAEALRGFVSDVDLSHGDLQERSSMNAKQLN
jgi:hypothetical protein